MRLCSPTLSRDWQQRRCGMGYFLPQVKAAERLNSHISRGFECSALLNKQCLQQTVMSAPQHSALEKQQQHERASDLCGNVSTGDSPLASYSGKKCLSLHCSFHLSMPISLPHSHACASHTGPPSHCAQLNGCKKEHQTVLCKDKSRPPPFIMPCSCRTRFI